MAKIFHTEKTSNRGLLDDIIVVKEKRKKAIIIDIAASKERKHNVVNCNFSRQHYGGKLRL